VDKSCNKRITAKDVALEAGVSRPLVSMYLSGNPKAWLSEETKARIDQAVKKLNYRPNLLAQSLKSGKTKTIGMVMGGLAHPFSGIFGEAMMEEAEKHGYRMFLALTRFEPAREHEALTNMARHQIDGVIYTLSANRDPEFFRQFENGPMPVLLTENHPELPLPCVAFDLAPGVRAALEAIRAAGMSKVLYITGWMDQDAHLIKDLGEFPGLAIDTMHWNPTDTDTAATIQRINASNAQAMICPHELLRHAQGNISADIRSIPVIQLPIPALCDGIWGVIECPFGANVRVLVKTLISFIENGGPATPAPQIMIDSKFYPQSDIAAWYDALCRDPDCGRYCH